MAPYSAGGAWVPAPGVSYVPPARPGGEPRTVDSVVGNKSTSSDSEWRPSTLTGSRSINVGGRHFKIPRAAVVKQGRRAGVVWVNYAGRTHIFSELGELNQTEADMRATRFDLL